MQISHETADLPTRQSPVLCHHKAFENIILQERQNNYASRYHHRKKNRYNQ